MEKCNQPRKRLCTIAAKSNTTTNQQSAISSSSEMGTDAEDQDAVLTIAELEAAAVRSRLPHASLSKVEQDVFKEIGAVVSPLQSRYLFLRNSVLALWLRKPDEKLIFNTCITSIQDGTKDANLIRRIHRFLERYGYINFGIYTSMTFAPKMNRRIIVIGAGIAGLIAARQMDTFGFDVTVLEARNRPGGRISTYMNDGMIADLGAMVVTGAVGNPLMVIAKQIHLDLKPISALCPLYDYRGHLVRKDVDESAERLFNKLLDACAYLGHSQNLESVAGRKLSLGEIFDFVLLIVCFKRHEQENNA
ncbi:unnamed protein product [Soboliphyme baturini]|uniref:SWIRM domain-containing protein n=1 Tax=Soboliphyme baturini TaxID=241478 RepID=A0A183IS58_9BILA|nr:unnamed protein product [Soboliphyme baturini]